MDPGLRPVAPEEIEAFVLADGYGFGDRWALSDHEAWARAELDRSVGAFVDGEIVATGRNYSLDLTLPGGTQLPAGGVSWISTRPTHRRQGLLRQVMTALMLESRDRGEPASLLTASEGGIYSRFGYGVATEKASIAVSKATTRFRDAPSAGTVRLIEPERAVAIARPLFERVRSDRAGAVSRSDAWWTDEWAPSEWIDRRHRFDVVYEVDGEPEGYALYAIDGDWSDGFTAKFVAVRDLLATTPRAEHALWHYLFHIDQTVELRAWHTPLDSMLPWLLTDAREVRTVNRRDWLWLRPIDTAVLLGSRTYGADDDLTIAVADPFLGLEETIGTFALTSRAGETTCRRTDRAPDLRMDADALGSILLGGVVPSILGRAGRIAADPDALRRADAMFRTERLPFGFSWF